MIEWLKHIIPAFAINNLIREQLSAEKSKVSDLTSLARDQLATIEDQASKMQSLELDVAERENQIKELTTRLNYMLKQNNLRDSVVPLQTVHHWNDKP